MYVWNFEQPNMKWNNAWIEWQAFKCYHHVLNWFFLPKPGFFGIYLNFQRQKPLKNQYFPYCDSKSYQTNSIKSCFVQNFQLQFNLIFSQEIVQYSRTFQPQFQTSWNQAHARTLASAELSITPRRTRCETSRFGGSHNCKIKQTTFLHR
jgi:hypothetical protein